MSDLTDERLAELADTARTRAWPDDAAILDLIAEVRRRRADAMLDRWAGAEQARIAIDTHIRLCETALERDPVAARDRRSSGDHQMTLALDLGRNLGWAHGDADRAETGLVKLDHDDDADLFAAAFASLEALIVSQGRVVDLLAYENPPPRYRPGIHPNDRAARVLYGLRAIVLACARRNDVPAILAVTPQAAKRALAGRASAAKADMIGWAWRRFELEARSPGVEHRADALGVLLVGAAHLARARQRKVGR